MSQSIELVCKRPIFNRVVLTLHVLGEATIDDIIDAAKRLAHDDMPFGYQVARRGDFYDISVFTD